MKNNIFCCFFGKVEAEDNMSWEDYVKSETEKRKARELKESKKEIKVELKQ